MDPDTEIGGRGGAFPRTRGTLVAGARSPEGAVRARAMETLVAAYWKPVYKHLRLRWRASNEDAKDWTQGFFAEALEKGWIERFDPAKAKFRTWLRVCLDGFVARAREAASAAKRGGRSAPLPLEFEEAEGEIARRERRAPDDPDESFQREWVRSLFALAVEDLRRLAEASGRGVPFDVFRRYDLEGADAAEPPTYAALAAALGIPATQVTNHLHWARGEFRRIVLERLAESCGSEAEFRDEARALLGGSPR